MKNILALIVILLVGIVPVACSRHYSVSPLPVPTITLTPTATATHTFTSTPTSTPTIASTPGCGFTNISVPTPAVINPPLVSATFTDIPGSTYVIRNLADWQAYYGSSSAPPQPVDFSQYMILVDLQAGGNYSGVSVVSVCWDDSQVTVIADVYPPCDCTSRGPIGIYFGTPSPTPTFTPSPTPSPTPIPIPYKATAIAVPISSLPVVWQKQYFVMCVCIH
jgi:hypothetical protein